MKFRSIVAFGMAAILFLAAISATFGGAAVQENALVAATEDKLTAVGAVQESKIRAIFEENEQLLQLMASRTQMRISMQEFQESGAPAAQAKMEKILLDAVLATDSFHAAFLMARNGSMIAKTEDHAPFPPLLSPTQTSVSNFTIPEGKSEPVNLLVQALYLEEDWLGHLFVEADAATLGRSLSTYDGLGASGETMVAQRNAGGALFLGPLRHEADAEFQRVVSYENAKVPVIEGLAGFSGFLSNAPDYRGTSVMADVRVIPEHDLVVVTKIDRAEALSSVRDATLVQVAVGVLVLAGALIAAAWLSGRLTKPLASLEEEVSSLTPETSTVDPNFGRFASDELLSLTSTINSARLKMMDAVSGRVRLMQMVSHELNTPLMPATIELTMLREEFHGPITTEQRSSLDAIERQLGKVSEMTEQMLQLSRIENSQGSCMLAGPLSAAVAAYANVANQKNLSLIPHVQDARIRGAAKHWEQVFENLLSNAIKYSDAGTLHVSSRREETAAVISIRDEGIGLPEGLENEIFDPFVRVHDAHDADAPGTGLGLYVVRRIVETFGGSIEAIRHDDGTEICIRAPYSKKET